MSRAQSARQALRQVPGARATKRSLLGAYHALHPLRPPVESPDLVERMLAPSEDGSFFTGNGLASHCRYVLNYDVFHVNEHVQNNWWFANPEFLEFFFRRLAPRETYVLFTHNSNTDRPIGPRFERRLRQPELTAWFSTQVVLRHPKLFPIPIGVGNPIKCNEQALKRVSSDPPRKSLLFEASFDIRTNVVERMYCIEQTGIQPTPKLPVEAFFERLASAYFCISPSGNGIDCYRTWQALHLRTIPIVTRSRLTETHPELPMIVLDGWSQFRTIDFSPELYARTWGDWDPVDISLHRYLGRIERTLVAQQGASAP